MSAITTNPFTTGYSAIPSPNEPFAADAGGRPAAVSSDLLTPTVPIGGGGDPAQAPGWMPAGGGIAGFESLMNGFITSIQNLLAGLGQSFGLGGASSSPTAPAGAQTYYRDATASSIGDPHDSFDGTTGAGAPVNGTWDSMQSHGDLLSSDSFAGGYRVSTSATAPNASGVTLNANATVTTDGGNTSVSMNADGSYDVRSGGSAVSLTTGQAVSLDDGETVTLNADRSLTVRDANASGGTIATTLRSNGDGGVDVSNTAHDVDLGGYLANRGRAAGGDGPRRPAPIAVDPSVNDGISLL